MKSHAYFLIALLPIGMALYNKGFLKLKHLKILSIFILLCGILYVCISLFDAAFGIPKLFTETVEMLSYQDSQKYTLNYLLNNPRRFLLLLFNLLRLDGFYYIQSMIVGPLGWLNISIPLILLLYFLVLLIGTVIPKLEEESIFNKNVKTSFLFISVLTFVAIELALLLDWTPIDYPIIAGIQGRYFLPFLPLMLLCFNNNSIKVTKNIDDWYPILIIIGLILTVVSVRLI